MSRGFTFQQLAVILLVMLGLIVVIVMVSMQARKTSSGFGSISGDIETMGGETSSVSSCEAAGNKCARYCDKTLGIKGSLGCGDDEFCCTTSITFDLECNFKRGTCKTPCSTKVSGCSDLNDCGCTDDKYCCE